METELDDAVKKTDLMVRAVILYLSGTGDQTSSYSDIMESAVGNQGGSSEIKNRLAKVRKKMVVMKRIQVTPPAAAEEGTTVSEADYVSLRGECALNGHGVPQDLRKAKKCFEQAAEAGSGRAYTNMGKMYEAGVGCDRSVTEAFLCFRKAAELGEPGGQFALGKLYEKGLAPGSADPRGQAMDTAVAYYEDAAKNGSAEAMIKLGYMHEHGINFPRNATKALEYYKSAAELGDGLAYNALGLHYHAQGEYRSSSACFSTGRKLACARATNNLGICFEDGLGVSKDIEKALECYREAAEKRNPQAMVNLGNLLLRRANEAHSSELFAQAATWFRLATVEDRTTADAYFALGKLYETGTGVALDPEIALKNFVLAASLGHAKACKKCGDMMYTGKRLDSPDIRAAAGYYRKAAGLGDSDSMNILGTIYEKGFEGTPQNLEEAMKMFEGAYRLGNQYAGVGLARLIVEVRKDRLAAQRLIEEIVEKGDEDVRNYVAKQQQQGFLSGQDDNETI